LDDPRLAPVVGVITPKLFNRKGIRKRRKSRKKQEIRYLKSKIEDERNVDIEGPEQNAKLVASF
jgi:hypothetical protein